MCSTKKKTQDEQPSSENLLYIYIYVMATHKRRIGNRVRLRGANREAIKNKCEEEDDDERNKGFFRKRVEKYITRISFARVA